MRSESGEAGSEATLRAHPRSWADDMTVRFSGRGPSGQEITVMAWFRTTEFAEFTGFRQEMLLAILEVIERAGCRVAYPSTTVHLADRREERR